MLKAIQVAAALDPVVSLDEAKEHCRIDAESTIEDELIESFVAAATARLEKLLETAFVTQSWRQDFSGFSDCMRLPLRPVDPDSVLIDYRDADNNEQTIDAESFIVLTDEFGSYVSLLSGYSWPSTIDRPNAVSVYFDAGYSVEDVPPELKMAVKLLVGAWNENREQTVIGVNVAELPMSLSVHALISSHLPMHV
jgi:uncharacterized phiE125 gp8 family phage protein